MLIEFAPIISNQKISSNIFQLIVKAPVIAQSARPGQFCNLKITDYNLPLLRRPLSIGNVENTNLSFLYEVKGKGTYLLSQKKQGGLLNIFGPLGNGFNFEDDFVTAVLVAGGIGIAPFPFLTRTLKNRNKKIVTFYGLKNKEQIITNGLLNVRIATDDGSMGLKGTVLDLLRLELKKLQKEKIKIFACGPNAMLKNLKNLVEKKSLNCEMSLETIMACGYGVCQGCVVPAKGAKSFKLVCTDGPVFKTKDLLL